MSWFLRSAFVVAAAAAFASTSAVADQLIVNGGFETGNFSGWTVDAGATGVSDAGGLGGYDPHSGSYFAYLGNVGGLGSLSQSFADMAGRTYTFSYYLASNGTTPSEFAAEFDGRTLVDVVNPASAGYTLYSFSVTGTGHDSITLLERNDPNYLALDDVSFSTASNAPTPEPSSIALLGTGLMGAMDAARRRWKR